MGSYRIADDPAKLLKRFEAGEKHISVEYCIQEEDGTICWVQKTVLMTQTIVFDTELSCEIPVVHAIILLQDTSQMHARDEQSTRACRRHLMKCGRQTGRKQIS
ncbi:MAG: hypothetical protein ACLR3S_08635 [Clostridium fessum]